MGFKLKDISTLLDCKVIYGEELLELDIKHCFCADLMSDVLAYTKADTLLLTGLTNTQSVRTAHVADIKAIIYLRGKIPDKTAIDCAKEKRIPLLTTNYHTISACGILYKNDLIEDF